MASTTYSVNKIKSLSGMLDAIISDNNLTTRKKLTVLEFVRDLAQVHINNIEDDLIDQKWAGMETEE